MAQGVRVPDDERIEKINKICDMMASGKVAFLTHACEAVGVSVRTVESWREQDKAIDQLLQQAWDLSALALTSDMVRISDTPNHAQVATRELDKDGNVEKTTVKIEDNVHRDRLRIYAREKAVAVIMARFLNRKPPVNPNGTNGVAPEDRTEYTEAQLDYIIEHGDLPPDQPVEDSMP